MLKTIFKIFLLLLSVGITLLVFIFAVAVPTPENTEEIIDEVMRGEFPELILGDTGKILSGSTEIWYESIMPDGEPRGVILLIMGLGGTALEWPKFFTDPLVNDGFQVIRFDNRGTGLSSWPSRRYNLHDMSRDAWEVLDKLEIDRVHLMGMSMGGMIAQIMAIEHPERVVSLTSLSSSGYLHDPELPGLDHTKVVTLAATGIRYELISSDRGTIKSMIAVRKLLAHEITHERVVSLVEQNLFNLRLRRRSNPLVFIQHTLAIRLSGSRYEGLRNLKVPALIIHGKEDPLIDMVHGIKTAELIPDAELLLLEGLGHDISPDHTEAIHRAFFFFWVKSRIKRRNAVGKQFLHVFSL